MAATIAGAAVFWGIGSSFVASGTGISGTGVTLNPQSVDFATESESVEIPNYQGETVAKVYHNARETMTIVVIPSADTIAHVKSGAILPAPGAVVTIVDTDDTEVAGAVANNNAWRFVRGSKKRSNKNAVELTFEIERLVANDIGASPS
jgi:hypothetical protein